MNSQRQYASCRGVGQGRSTPNRPAVCTTICPGLNAPSVARPDTRGPKSIVGHREQHEVRGSDHGVWSHCWHAGKQGFDAAHATPRRRQTPPAPGAPPRARRRLRRRQHDRRPRHQRRACSSCQPRATPLPARARAACSSSSSRAAATSRCAATGCTGPGVECTVTLASPRARCSGPCRTPSDCVRSCGTSTNSLVNRPERIIRAPSPARTPRCFHCNGSTIRARTRRRSEAVLAARAGDSSRHRPRGVAIGDVWKHEPESEQHVVERAYGEERCHLLLVLVIPRDVHGHPVPAEPTPEERLAHMYCLHATGLHGLAPSVKQSVTQGADHLATLPR